MFKPVAVARLGRGLAAWAATALVALATLLAPAPASAVSYVRSVEYVEVNLGAGATTASVNLTKGQVAANCVPFASMMVSGTDDQYRQVFTDVYFQTAPVRVTAQRNTIGGHVVGRRVRGGVRPRVRERPAGDVLDVCRQCHRHRPHPGHEPDQGGPRLLLQAPGDHDQLERLRRGGVVLGRQPALLAAALQREQRRRALLRLRGQERRVLGPGGELHRGRGLAQRHRRDHLRRHGQDVRHRVLPHRPGRRRQRGRADRRLPDQLDRSSRRSGSSRSGSNLISDVRAFVVQLGGERPRPARDPELRGGGPAEDRPPRSRQHRRSPWPGTA